MTKFDTTKYQDPYDVFRDLLATELRIRERRRKIEAIEKEGRLDEHRISQLDRWGLAIFEQNPDHQCVKISHGYKDYILSPGDGLVTIRVPESPHAMEMVDYPIEDDADDIECDDDMPSNDELYSSFARTIYARRQPNGHIALDGQITS
jgi:hypothetical protein